MTNTQSINVNEIEIRIFNTLIKKLLDRNCFHLITNVLNKLSNHELCLLIENSDKGRNSQINFEKLFQVLAKSWPEKFVIWMGKFEFPVEKAIFKNENSGRNYNFYYRKNLSPPVKTFSRSGKQSTSLVFRQLAVNYAREDSGSEQSERNQSNLKLDASFGHSFCHNHHHPFKIIHFKNIGRINLKYSFKLNLNFIKNLIGRYVKLVPKFFVRYPKVDGHKGFYRNHVYGLVKNFGDVFQCRVEVASLNSMSGTVSYGSYEANINLTRKNYNGQFQVIEIDNLDCHLDLNDFSDSTDLSISIFYQDFKSDLYAEEFSLALVDLEVVGIRCLLK